jgi:hypothetical protein
MRAVFPWVKASLLGALVWGIPMSFLMQRPTEWGIGSAFAQHLVLWFLGGAAWGCYMRYLGLRRARNKV